jgi:queuine tRNA-ribosyltransferase
MKFQVLATENKARRGIVETAHGSFNTPAFMPVGTKAAVKSLYPDQLRAIGTEILLSNTYHLRLRPGDEYLRNRGGLHKFMGWNGPILTDSGGYQVFSMAKLCVLKPDGVEFSSHIDGSREFFTPELVVDIQRNIGSDIMMPLDHPVPGTASRDEANQAMTTTLNWLERGLRHWKKVGNDRQDLFAIVQGGPYEDLRRECVKKMIDLDPPGFAIGGLAVGEPKETLYSITEVTASLLPKDKPRYLMGVGTPEDIIRSVAAGVDMFDCILPTRMGRTGWAYTSEGAIKLRNAAYKDDDAPIDPACSCNACRAFSRAVIRHYFNIGEILGPAALSLHNVFYYQSLMKKIRDAIAAGRFEEMVKNAQKF